MTSYDVRDWVEKAFDVYKNDLDEDWPISFGCDGGFLEALAAPRMQY